MPIDYTEFSIRNQREALRALAKKSNNDLYRLRKAQVDLSQNYSYEIANEYLRATGRKYFSSALSLTDAQVTKELREIQRFQQDDLSTISGYRERITQSKQTLDRLGLDISLGEIPAFYSFLNSQSFKDLRQYVNSNFIIEDIEAALDEGYSIDEIKSDYNDFLNNTQGMTFEQIDEQRRSRQNLFR